MLVDGDRPERVTGLRVSPNFFTLLGVAPARGRLFTPDEETPGRGKAEMLADVGAAELQLARLRRRQALLA
mgnify:CR=1 FL=1